MYLWVNRMKSLFRRLTAFLLAFILLSCLSHAFAVRSDYADIRGHWAENALLRALNDRLIEDTGDGLKQDDPITWAGMLTIICKVLSADGAADQAGADGTDNADAADAAAVRAAALGLISSADSRLNLHQNVTRGKAFVVLAEAFQLVAAEPDFSVLSKFSDGSTLSGAYRPAAAALVSFGYVSGINGAIHINRSISLAEFLTVLYKILPEYGKDAADLPSAPGGAVFTGGASVSGRQFNGGVYFDCASSNIRLQNITAPSVVLRSDNLGALSLFSCKIDRLVLAAAGGDVFLNPGFTSDIKTAVVGTGGGKITLGSFPNVEVTGSNREVVITGSVKSLLVSGSNNKITLVPGSAADSVKLLVSGAGNTLSVGGLVNECSVFGPNTVISGTGTVRRLLDNSKGSSITANTVNTAVNKGYGLNDVSLTLTAPDNLSAYEKLKASVAIDAPDGSRLCQGAWYINDALVSLSELDVGATDTVLLDYDIITGGDETAATVAFILSYTDSGGFYQEIRAEKTVTIQNSRLDAAEVLALVTTGYKGDHTLAWAESNDYNGAVKTAWVNAKGYSSKTDYLIWVNIAYQRVNVFTGSAGNWSLVKTFIVGTGASGHDTPTGVFKVIGKSTIGWTTKAYTVKPVIFFLNYAYGFHSRLYEPGTTNVSDARIGFPVSHGCVRMYDEDVAWIFDNIPADTTVVVY
jgi:lipoprotein-anchoring transpeptidase ErfK/SrfK